ncbi:hypothetical protein [Nocardia fluminea]|uniref:hypothetical protein n=1 Tax=Nocardia fluminea TaxID=134984 RepID=UPI000C6FF22A|nr:hypothetical protein [Nocardia fluminea]
MNTLTRTLITTFPLLCAAGVAAAPAAAHAESGAPPAARPATADVAPVPRHSGHSPICARGAARAGVVLARPPERGGQAIPAVPHAAAPGTMPTASTVPYPRDATSSGRHHVEPPVAIILGAAASVEFPVPEAVRRTGGPVQSPERPSSSLPCGPESPVVPMTVPRRELVPVPVPVQVRIHDLGSAPARPQGTDQSAGARPDIEIMVRAGGGSGSAAELPPVLRELLRSLAGQQRVPSPRPHR